MIIQPGRFLGILLLLHLAAVAGLKASPGYIGLEEIADDLGLNVTWTEPERAVRLEGSSVSMDFREASRIVSLNGIKVFLGQPVLANRGQLYLAAQDWRDSLQPILMPRIFPNPPGYRRVVIDAGHGGKDPGGQNPRFGMDEKDLALEMSRLIGKRLQQEGFEVGFTRTTDRFIPLGDRPRIANRGEADFFLSIHFNAAKKSVRGVETFIYTLQGTPSSSRSALEEVDRAFYTANANDPWNALLGYYLQAELVRTTRLPDRGLKRARFAVLEELRSPGALLELGFISNDQTAQLLRDPRYRERLAESVVSAVQKYRQTLIRLSR